MLRAEVPYEIGYCNDGKQIFVYVGHGTFGIFDPDTLQLRAEVNLDTTSLDSSKGFLLAAACASQAPVAVLEVVSVANGKGLSELIDLTSGKASPPVAEDVGTAATLSIDISPSGALVATLLSGNIAIPAFAPSGLAIFDPKTGTKLQSIHASTVAGQILFVGETRVAVASGDSYPAQSGPAKLFDVASGRLVRQFDASPANTLAPLGVSGDERLLMLYSGLESRNDDGLQIQSERFLVWALPSGNVMAQSPALEVTRTGAQPVTLINLPSARTVSWRPRLHLSQNGHAVLMTQPPGFGGPVDVWFF